MELVSVIIPVYNGVDTIKRCVYSVLNQSWKNLEVIIVDDGSTDRTLDFITNEFGTNAKIKIIHQENSGSAAAKNTGIKNAKGDYFQFLDCDDHISADKIKNQLDIIGQDKSVLVWCSTLKNSFKNEHAYKCIDKKKLYKINDPLEFLLCLNGLDGDIGMIQPNAYLVTKELYYNAGIWNEELRHSPDDDSEFFSRVILNSKKIIFDSKSINYYTVSKDSVSKKFNTLSSSGALKTVQYKFENILLKADSIAIRALYRRHLSITAYLYGRFNDTVLNDSLNIIQKLGFKNFAFVGGVLFRIVFFFTSFKTSLKAQQILINMKSSLSRKIINKFQ